MTPGTRPSGRRPQAAVVQPCAGAPELAGLAREVARRLRELGMSTSVLAPDVAASAAEEDAVAVALDGCDAACSRRALEARGLRTVGIIVADEPGDRPPAERILALLRAEDFAPSPPRRRRAPRPRAPRASSRPARAHSVNDYLRAIHALSSPLVDCGAVVDGAPALAAHVSHVLGVSRPTSGEMLKRLEKAGLVERGPSREVLLTAAGRAMAERAVRRHRVVECFLVDYLGTSPADAPVEASAVEAGMDDELVERIHERLGRPARCPHGWPVDPAREREERRSLVALAALRPGERGVVVGLVEGEGELLRNILDHGLAPGAEVEVEAVGPGGEPLTALVAGRRRQLSKQAAEAVFVRRGEPSLG